MALVPKAEFRSSSKTRVIRAGGWVSSGQDNSQGSGRGALTGSMKNGQRPSGGRAYSAEETRRCLIVDDEPGLRRLLVRLMESDGFSCSEASTATDALAQL